MSGFFGRLKGALLATKDALGVPPWSPSAEALASLRAIAAEAERHFPKRNDRVALSRLESWQTLTSSAPALQMEVTLAAVRNLSRDGTYLPPSKVWNPVAQALLRKTLPWSEREVLALLRELAEARAFWNTAPLPILGVVEGLLQGAKAQGSLRTHLRRVQSAAEEERYHAPSQTVAVTLNRLDAMLSADPVDPAAAICPDSWSEAVLRDLAALPEATRAGWARLFRHAGQGVEKPRPTKLWLATAGELVEQLGRDQVRDAILTWLRPLTGDGYYRGENERLLKGLVWLLSDFEAQEVAAPIGRLAEDCLGKGSSGQRSPLVGNACLWTLGNIKPMERGAAELARLATAVKYPSGRQQIAKYMESLAKEAETTVEDLAEETLPDHGLEADGRRTVALDGGTATLSLVAEGVELSWAGADGTPRKAVPAPVKEKEKAALAAVRQAAKDLEAARLAECRRLEASWLEERSWPLETWRRRFLEHPLRRPLAQSLIWRLESDDRTHHVLPRPEGLVDQQGASVAMPAEATVSLWHPLQGAVAEVLAWRHLVLERGLVQPLKQAHREVYVLTDAERETRLYSNRFAAHILRQHVFAKLCRQRGWDYHASGVGWGDQSGASRRLPGRNLTITFDVKPIDSGPHNTVAAPFVTTDGVDFYRGEPVPLTQIEPLLFSELMRDIDLFVSVCSVAHDDHWQDGGPNGRFGAYWRGQQERALDAGGTIRRELLAELLPKLSIADRLTLGKRHLEVRGRRNSYAIHLNSANVQMLPDKRYLCIVGRSGGVNDQVRLPFAGDLVLSLILSKAFLLAADDRIKDASILSQMQR